MKKYPIVFSMLLTILLCCTFPSAAQSNKNILKDTFFSPTEIKDNFNLLFSNINNLSEKSCIHPYDAIAFKKYFWKRLHSVNFLFQPIPHNKTAINYRSSDQKKTIDIYLSTWKKLSPFAKQLLLLHEALLVAGFDDLNYELSTAISLMIWPSPLISSLNRIDYSCQFPQLTFPMLKGAIDYQIEKEINRPAPPTEHTVAWTETHGGDSAELEAQTYIITSLKFISNLVVANCLSHEDANKIKIDSSKNMTKIRELTSKSLHLEYYENDVSRNFIATNALKTLRFIFQTAGYQFNNLERFILNNIELPASGVIINSPLYLKPNTRCENPIKI